MSTKTVSAVHWSFWAISAVALLWNVMGSINFFMQINAAALASFPKSHRAIIEGRPVWAIVGFVVAVFGGALDCLLLLLRKTAAYYLFIASLLGAIVTMIHALGIVRSANSFSPFEVFLAILMPLVVAAFLIWYSKWAKRRGWINWASTSNSWHQ